jgi:hypothetical protein
MKKVEVERKRDIERDKKVNGAGKRKRRRR